MSDIVFSPLMLWTAALECFISWAIPAHCGTCSYQGQRLKKGSGVSQVNSIVSPTLLYSCHCEERNDEAISAAKNKIASLRSQ